MPQVDIPDETFAKLVRRAAKLNVTVEELVAPVLERAAETETENGHASPALGLSYDQWKVQFDNFLATVRSRAERYPPGFQADVSRESIYEGCGE